MLINRELSASLFGLQEQPPALDDLLVDTARGCQLWCCYTAPPVYGSCGIPLPQPTAGIALSQPASRSLSTPCGEQAPNRTLCGWTARAATLLRAHYGCALIFTVNCHICSGASRTGLVGLINSKFNTAWSILLTVKRDVMQSRAPAGPVTSIRAGRWGQLRVVTGSVSLALGVVLVAACGSTSAPASSAPAPVSLATSSAAPAENLAGLNGVCDRITVAMVRAVVAAENPTYQQVTNCVEGANAYGDHEADYTTEPATVVGSAATLSKIEVGPASQAATGQSLTIGGRKAVYSAGGSEIDVFVGSDVLVIQVPAQTAAADSAYVNYANAVVSALAPAP